MSGACRYTTRFTFLSYIKIHRTFNGLKGVIYCNLCLLALTKIIQRIIYIILSSLKNEMINYIWRNTMREYLKCITSKPVILKLNTSLCNVKLLPPRISDKRRWFFFQLTAKNKWWQMSLFVLSTNLISIYLLNNRFDFVSQCSS